MKPKAVALFSGGLDSTTCLYAALRDGYDVAAITIHYGQLHQKEIACAQAIAADLKIHHYIVPISMPWKGSALLDSAIEIPLNRNDQEMTNGIPSTYVPARNSVFLCLAASLAETIDARAIYLGVNAQDYSGYPDCRPVFLEAFSRMIELGTKAGSEGSKFEVKAPLLYLSKKEIVLFANSLQVPLAKTWSCYLGGETPCNECDSCKLRAKGFRESGLEDPLLYAASSH